MRRVAVLATALLASMLAPVAIAAEEERDPIVEAVGDVLHGADAATRERARELLRSHPDEAVRVLLQALEEVAAARRPPVAVSTLERGAAATDAPPAPGDELVVQIYDVRDLVELLGSADELVERLGPEIDEGETVATQADGVLIVRALPRSHADLQTALTALRRDSSEIVRIETRVVEAPLTAALGRDMSGARAGDVVTLHDPVETIATWIRTGDARVVTSPALSCFPEQRASVNAGREISFVADFDVEVAQSAFIADPIVDTIYAGITIDLVPHTSGEGRVRLDVHATATDVDLETFRTSLGVLQENVEIQVPALVRSEVERAVDMADGESVIVHMGDDGQVRRFVVLTVSRDSLADEDDE